MNLTHATKEALLQVLLVAVYFPIYFLLGPLIAMIYAGLFLIVDFLAWPSSFRTHLTDRHHGYLLVTVVTSCFAILGSFANAYEVFGNVVSDHGELDGLGSYLYFSVVTFTTLGYGDYVPTGPARIFAAVEAMLGFTYFAVIVGVSGSIFYARIAARQSSE